ncbi:hypothetical protein J3F83DRAFT_734538 [Trichoderma novae-zelandiae]
MQLLLRIGRSRIRRFFLSLFFLVSPLKKRATDSRSGSSFHGQKKTCEHPFLGGAAALRLCGSLDNAVFVAKGGRKRWIGRAREKKVGEADKLGACCRCCWWFDFGVDLYLWAEPRLFGVGWM